MDLVVARLGPDHWLITLKDASRRWRMGYLPRPTTLICSECGLIEATENPKHMGQRLSEFSEYQTQEIVMADNSSSGFLGVLVGALVVIALVVVVAFGTGMFGSKDTATLKVEAPKIGTNK